MAVASRLVAAELYIQNCLSRLPPILGKWLGHRGQRLPPPTLCHYCLSGFIGAFGGIGVLFAVFGHTGLFTTGNVPPIVVSFVSAESLLTLALLTQSCTGRLRNSLLWRRRRSVLPAPPSYPWPLLECPHWRHHCYNLSP